MELQRDVAEREQAEAEQAARTKSERGGLARRRRESSKLLLYNRLEAVSGAAHCSNLFLYLWAINEDGHCCRGVRVPDTIIVQKARPSASPPQ